jgi:hypothetical protein
MHAITTKQCVRAALAYTLGWILWAFPEGSATKDTGAIILCFSAFITMRPDERSRPLRWSDYQLVLLAFVLLVLATLLIEHASPGFMSTYFHNHVLAGLLWAFMIWRLYRQWRQTSTCSQTSNNDVI